MNEVKLDSFAARLRAWRDKRDWTQRQAADYLGSALQTYQHWEQGEFEPRGAALRGIERAIQDDGL